MTPRLLPPSQALAVLSALLPPEGDPLDATRLAAGTTGLRVFPAGPPRQLAALLAWYDASVRLEGLDWLLDESAARFGRLVAGARHRLVPAAIRLALRPPVAHHLVVEVGWEVARAFPAVRAEGAVLLTALLAPAPRARRRAPGQVAAEHGLAVVTGWRA